MATRSLTKKFVDARNASKANRNLNFKSTFELGDDSYSDRDNLKVFVLTIKWKFKNYLFLKTLYKRIPSNSLVGKL